MDFITVLVLAFALCFDSFAVSLSSGMSKCGGRKLNLIRFALILAVFQGAMPFIGWILATNLHTHIAKIDHWVAFILLSILGANMIKESLAKSEESVCNPFKFKKACVLGFATSIDALITGVAMAMVKINIIGEASQGLNMLIAVLIIALVTFASSITGLFVGRTATKRLGKRAELIGGIILVCIGLKVLVEHILSL